MSALSSWLFGPKSKGSLSSHRIVTMSGRLLKKIALPMRPPENGDLSAQRRHQLILLALVYRYMAWLFWLGVATVFAMVVVLLYESVAVTAKLLLAE